MPNQPRLPFTLPHMPHQTRRLAFTVPAPLSMDLSYVALRLGVSKSDLVVSLIADPLAKMRSVLFRVPEPLDVLTPEDRDAVLASVASMLADAVAEGSTALGAVRKEFGGTRG